MPPVCLETPVERSGQEKGAREVQKWLGLTWDELVEKYQGPEYGEKKRLLLSTDTDAQPTDPDSQDDVPMEFI